MRAARWVSEREQRRCATATEREEQSTLTCSSTRPEAVSLTCTQRAAELSCVASKVRPLVRAEQCCSGQRRAPSRRAELLSPVARPHPITIRVQYLRCGFEPSGGATATRNGHLGDGSSVESEKSSCYTRMRCVTTSTLLHTF